MNIRLTQAALKELQEACAFYEMQQPGLGLKFLDEVETCKSLIQNHPLAWHPLDTQFRRCRLSHFPYGLIYRIKSDHIEVTAVAHLHRKPDYWKAPE